MNTKMIKFLVLLVASVLFSQSSFAQMVVVAGAKSEVPMLTKDQVSSLFTGAAFQYPNGTKAVLIDQSDSTDARQKFYGKITEKSASQLKSTWSRLTFSGKGSPPREVASSAEVKKVVSGDAAAIGYIEKGAVDGSVKVLYSTDP